MRSFWQIGDAMSILKTLKTSKKTRVFSGNPLQSKRYKLLRGLEQQQQVAKAVMAGGEYTATRLVTQPNADGMLERVEVPKRVRKWFWSDADGIWHMQVRYGARVLTLNNKNDTAIEFGDLGKLGDTIEAIKQAVNAGEFDNQLETIKFRNSD